MIADWMQQHRDLEALLEELAAAADIVPLFPVVARHVLHHYQSEDAQMPEKIRRQHDEVRELIRAIQDEPEPSLVRRFIALASHNIIEEERDWFPLLTSSDDAPDGSRMQ